MAGAETWAGCSQGAWRGPRAGPVEGGMGRRAVLPKSLPYLRRLTLLCRRWAPPQPEPVREGGGAEKRSCCSWAVQAQRPGLWYMGCQDEAKKFLTPPPNPGLGSCPGPSTIIPCPAPARSPPNNNQRKRKRCHLPMPALRVSKPSGMGGARQLLGAWRGGGLPGGGTRDRLPGAPKLT